MHLLVSSVGDATSDLICERIGDSVLRLNWERWGDYRVVIDERSFEVSDSFDRVVTEETLENIIWRKPVPDISIDSGEAWYAFQEFKYAIECIVDRVRRDAPVRLPIDPRRNAAASKFRQLEVASRYLKVPAWRWTSAPSRGDWSGRTWVVKSLTGEPIPGTGTPAKIIFTTRVDPHSLRDGFPWFLQEEVVADRDLTIVFVDGAAFGFELDRRDFSGLDWRRHIGDPTVQQTWRRVVLPTSLVGSITLLMAELQLRFGRVDLLVGANEGLEQASFLEVNPNGQWAWLDLEQDNGLFDAVVQFLTASDVTPYLAT